MFDYRHRITPFCYTQTLMISLETKKTIIEISRHDTKNHLSVECSRQIPSTNSFVKTLCYHLNDHLKTNKAGLMKTIYNNEYNYIFIFSNIFLLLRKHNNTDLLQH